jgi:hypothetical protein
MKSRSLSVKTARRAFLLILVLAVLAGSGKAQMRPDKNWRNREPYTDELFAFKKYKDAFAGRNKSGFSFKYGVRSDVAPEITTIQLTYGRLNWNGDYDWFMVVGNRSRIKDMGAVAWFDIEKVPYLPLSDSPYSIFIKPPSKNENVEQATDGRVTKVVLGHMYVLHTKDSSTDLYALFRVEQIVPSDRVTISWKVVPSPKK